MESKPRKLFFIFEPQIKSCSWKQLKTVFENIAQQALKIFCLSFFLFGLRIAVIIAIYLRKKKDWF